MRARLRPSGIDSSEVGPEKGATAALRDFTFFQTPPGGGGATRGTAEAKRKVGPGGRSAESCDAAVVKLTRKWIRVSAQPKPSFDFPLGHKGAKTILASSPTLLRPMSSFVFTRAKLFDGIHGRAEEPFPLDFLSVMGRLPLRPPHPPPASHRYAVDSLSGGLRGFTCNLGK